MNVSTRKLFWADAYRRRFTARVMQCQQGERPSVMLNRTLFTPPAVVSPTTSDHWAGQKYCLSSKSTAGFDMLSTPSLRILRSALKSIGRAVGATCI